jgi:hypothetical protein
MSYEKFIIHYTSIHDPPDEFKSTMTLIKVTPPNPLLS